MRITLQGRPITKKNSQKIIVNRTTHRPMIIQSDQYRQYEEACMWILKGLVEKPLSGRFNLCCKYWMPDKRGEPDLIGLLQATADILEKAGIVENDRMFRMFDGSIVVGVDKQNPRVEICISELQEGT